MNEPPIRRYFDHAATSFPKPPGVAAAMIECIERAGSAGRGAYREAVAAARLLEGVREKVRRLFSASAQDHVIFTFNGTDALNLAIKSLVNPGQHVVTTQLDHNSVLRPLSALHRRRGIEWTAVEPDGPSTIIDPHAVIDELHANTSLVIMTHASNVTGALQPIAAIGEACRARGITFLVDAAQTAGHVPIDFSSLPIDLLATPGHKGLLGPLGTGLLLVRAGVERAMVSWREGGTGSASEQPTQPEFLPDKFESGSHNLPGLAGLGTALDWIAQRGIETLRAHEQLLAREFEQRLAEISQLTLYGPRDPSARVGVFSVRLPDLSPEELSAALEQAGILTRAGLHCAPLAHRAIGTAADGGTTRFSIGPFTTTTDVEAACAALALIASSSA